MALYRNLLFLAFIGCVRLEGELIAHPCDIDDKKCVTDATWNFLEKTSAGIPKYGIKPLDPLTISSLDVVVNEEMGLFFHFKNLTVTGMKNQKFSDFVMKTAAKSVLLKTKAEELHIVASVDIVLTKTNRILSGGYNATTSALGTTAYNYSFARFGDQEHFMVGPETNTCEIIGNPTVSISDDLQHALDNDPDAKTMKAEYEANITSLRKKTLCKIVEAAYSVLVHNIRASAKIFPKYYFFKGV